jgi:signal transduction histidine kinase
LAEKKVFRYGRIMDRIRGPEDVELRGLAAEQAALRRVATLVARSTASATVFRAVAEEVGGVFPGADFAMVARYDGDAVEVVGAWRRTGDEVLVGRRSRLGGVNVSTVVFERKAPGRVDHLAAEDTTPLTAAARATGIRSSVGAPISVEGHLWGVMIVSSTRDDGLPEGSEERLAAFTELVATAIANAQARDDLHALVEEQAALRRVATLVARGAPPDAVFAAVAHEVGELGPADLTLIGRYDPDGYVTGVAGWSRDGEPVAGTRARTGGHNVTALVYETGQAARIDRYTDASGPAAADAQRRGLESAVGSPISIEGRLWGVMLVGSRDGEPLPPSTERRLGAFTELMATAIANADSRAQLTASRARLVTEADAARRRVVRDLHDGAQQRLVHTVISLELAQRALGADGGAAGPLVADALVQAHRANEELRELSHGILPADLTGGGLRGGVDALVERLDLAVAVDLPSERFVSEIEASAYFVVAEALTNIVKHAHARSAAVSARVHNDVLHIEVRDDGIGGADQDGHGLVGMNDRVTALGGQLTVDSPAVGGTRVAATLPIASPRRAI